MAHIENERQYKWALARVEELLPLVKEETPMDDPNIIELTLLSELVADYSDIHYSIGKPTLVEVMELRLYEMKLTQKNLSEMLGVSPSRISDYMNGKCEPTLKIGREISRQLNISPAVVLGV